MTGFWRSWLTIWCLSVAVFGLVLVGGAFPATEGPVRLLLTAINPGATPASFDALTQFALGLMGAVTLGWSVTFYAAIRMAMRVGGEGWRWVTAGVLLWFVVDGTISTLTGFGLNVVPNTLLLIGYLLPVIVTRAHSAVPVA